MIRLVIVDDMPDIRNYLAEELAAASEQFSVVGAAEDGTEAVKLVDSLLPDVVLMDIQMKTRTEGIYAIRIIHESPADMDGSGRHAVRCFAGGCAWNSCRRRFGDNCAWQAAALLVCSSAGTLVSVDARHTDLLYADGTRRKRRCFPACRLPAN